MARGHLASHSPTDLGLGAAAVLIPPAEILQKRRFAGHAPVPGQIMQAFGRQSEAPRASALVAAGMAPLRPADPAEGPKCTVVPTPLPRSFAAFLVQEGMVTPAAIRAARAEGEAGDLGAVLCAHGALRPAALARARSRWMGLPLIDGQLALPDTGLMDTIGARRCLELQILPMGKRAGHTVIAFVQPDRLSALRPWLTEMFGPISPAVISAPELEATLWRLRSNALRHSAEARVAYGESCRQFRPRNLRGVGLLAGMVIVGLLAVASAPFLAALTLWAAFTLGCVILLRASALFMAMKPAPTPPTPSVLAPADLPVISVIVPLYRETDIAPRLLRRLGRLEYPRGRLDVVLAVEQDDSATRSALEGARLPAWMRIITVPDGPLRTKPRALNYALPHCRGSIIGIYDAEDAPARDQLRKVAARFAAAPPQVVCLQGVLDYYNPTTNWIARCFTLEYAIWFRMIMPGLQRLGIPLPLGGTTLFMRRDALEELGAWDAHNVTEDADLGIRIAAHGYRTEMLDSTTEEEANCRPKAWVRQRSRWIKGHMLTWAVHMRHPVRLWRALGPRAFLGYQVVFLGAQSQFLLAPVLWSFWSVAFGGWHPAAPALPAGLFIWLIALVVVAEALNISLAVLAARRTRHIGLWQGAPLLHLYFPLATIAAWQALYEALTRPYYWAKTSHGHFDSAEPAPTMHTASTTAPIAIPTPKKSPCDGAALIPSWRAAPVT